jgi:hypothetical protein
MGTTIMEMYKLTNDNFVIRMSDGARLHRDNKEIYQEYLDWIAEGNEPLPWDSSTDFTYWKLRKPEYPPVEDYIDGVVKGDQEQIQAYIDACLQ